MWLGANYICIILIMQIRQWCHLVTKCVISRCASYHEIKWVWNVSHIAQLEHSVGSRQSWAKAQQCTVADHGDNAKPWGKKCNAQTILNVHPAAISNTSLRTLAQVDVNAEGLAVVRAASKTLLQCGSMCAGPVFGVMRVCSRLACPDGPPSTTHCCCRSGSPAAVGPLCACTSAGREPAAGLEACRGE